MSEMTKLRKHLFDTLDRLADSKKNLEEETNRAVHVVQVANAIIESGKVQVEFIKAIKGDETTDNGFFTDDPKKIVR